MFLFQLRACFNCVRVHIFLANHVDCEDHHSARRLHCHGQRYGENTYTLKKNNNSKGRFTYTNPNTHTAAGGGIWYSKPRAIVPEACYKGKTAGDVLDDTKCCTTAMAAGVDLQADFNAGRVDCCCSCLLLPLITAPHSSSTVLCVTRTPRITTMG